MPSLAETLVLANITVVDTETVSSFQPEKARKLAITCAENHTWQVPHPNPHRDHAVWR